MRKTVSLLLVAGLAAAAFAMPAEAAQKKKKKKKPQRIERVVEWRYEAPAIGTPETPGVCLRPTSSCIDIATGPDDKFLQLEATDASGTAVAIEIGQDTDPDNIGTEHSVGIICGATTEPLPLEPGAPIVGFPWALGGLACPGAVGTQGTVKATLSNMP